MKAALHETSSKVSRVEPPHGVGRPFATGWRCVLELNEQRRNVSGSESALIGAIRRGADLRVGTGFRHHEHIDVGSSCRDLIHEFIDFRVTYLLEDRWTAGICSLRMPVQTPHQFGPRESMSFFMYNQDGRQAIARPYLDGAALASGNCVHGQPSFANMPLYTEFDRCDDDTNAPSSNFVYAFDFYRYCVAERWTEVLHHDAEGAVCEGSVADLVDAFRTGAEIKVAIRGLCADFCNPPESAMDHEVFVHVGSTYYYTESNLFIGITHPVVRVSPAIPLIYRSRGWDFGWLLPRTDGHLARWLCDPYTLKFRKSSTRHPMRWFVGI